jgi:glycerol-3-phosphate O-acyltransferase
MRFFRAFAFWLTGLLIRPFLKATRHKISPAEGVVLDPLRPICYVLSTRSWIDLLALRHVCRQQNLPLPQNSGLPNLKQPSCLYLPALLETRVRETELSRTLQAAAANPAYEVQIVPVSVFWGRDPGSETSLWRLLFADNPQAGMLRKWLIVMVNSRNLLLNFGQPLSFRRYLEAETDPARAVRKLARGLHFHFLRARTAALGPGLVSRRTVIEGVLKNPSVRRAIEEESKAKNRTIEQVQKRAERCVHEISANYTAASIRFLEIVLTYVWNRVFKGIDVRGLERVRALAQTHEIIYLPSHRSHADYLLMSYILYHSGLVPPHIAAGINLNFWPVGGLLRRCGAFYLRRSFAGDKVYTAVFRAYVDGLVQRGYPIEFFPEGGRSRTGRLLSPKAGLLGMVVESSLRQQARPVAVVPVFIGYDRAWEVASYFKELRGGGKQKESAEGLLKAGKILGKSYGKAYVNFAEPINLQAFADVHLPDWRALQRGEKPENFHEFVETLADENMRRINAAVMVNPVGLTALALLSSPKRAVSEAELIEQLGHFIWLQKGQPLSADQILPETDPRKVLEWTLPIARLRKVAHPWGDLVLAADKDAVLMTYNRNNIQHAFALPGLIATFFRTRGLLSEETIIMGCRALYPFLQREFFLPWEQCEAAVKGYLDTLTQLGLLSKEDGHYRRPDASQPAFSTLVSLGRSMDETLERYGMTAYLLADEYKKAQHNPAGASIRRDQFEEDCRTLAERMAILTGRDAPEFFDKTLFKGYLNTLIDIGLVSEVKAGEHKALTVNSKIEKIAERSLELLSDETRQTLLQLLSRRTPTGTPSSAG